MKKNTLPLLSILMLNWNGYSYTKDCIKSLLRSDYSNFEIILWDNGSKNFESDKLKKLFRNETRVKVYESKTNLGYASGMKEALRRASGEVIMISNNDMKYEKNCLSILLKQLMTDSRIGIVQPKLKHLGNDKKFDYSLASGGLVDMFGYPFARGRIFTTIEEDTAQYNSIKKISWCGIFMARKEVLKKVGFFNSIYFNYGEDMDLCFRVYAYGYDIYVVPLAVAYHESGAILKKNMLKKLYFHHRNNIILMLINWPLLQLLMFFPVRLLFDFLTIFYYLSVNFSVGAHAIIKAYMSLFSLSYTIYIERQKTQKKARYNLFDRVPYYKGSIAYDYFVRDKKTFNQLNSDNFKNGTIL